MIAGMIDIGYQGYIYIYLVICLFSLFISYCVPFELVVDEFLICEFYSCQSFYRNKLRL